MFCLRMAMALLPLVLFSLYLPYLLQIIADQMNEKKQTYAHWNTKVLIDFAKFIFQSKEKKHMEFSEFFCYQSI